MEFDEEELMDGEIADGITEDDLKRSLKEVRGKKTIFKMQHKLKRNLRARSKNKKLEDFEDHLENKGIDVNKDSLRSRIKKRATISDIEKSADRRAKKLLEKDDDDDEEIMQDVN